MKVLIACGGTGGHIYPGLAIAKVLEQQNDEVLFMGCQTRMEMVIVPQYGFPIIGMPIKGLNRRSLFKNLSLPYKIFKSIKQAKGAIKQFHPDVIIGTGGYAQFPVVIAGYLYKIPIYLQEQNAIPGLCDKVCKYFAKNVFTAYEGMEKYFGKKNVLFGNPIFMDVNRNESIKKEAFAYFGLSEKKPIIFFLGGSLGSEKMINFVFDHVDEFRKNDFQVILSTGKQNPISKYALTVNWVKIFPYIDRMDYAYAISTIVVSRAGASCLSELSCNKKATIVIPSPNVANNHQMRNAKKYEKKNAIILIEEKNIDKLLMNTIIDLIKNPEKRKTLEDNIDKFDSSHAAVNIVNYIKS